MNEQRTHHEGADKPNIPFFDKEWMGNLKKRAYEKAQPQALGAITPDSKYCFFVNPQLKQALVEEGIRAEYLIHEDEYSNRGVILHAFVTAKHDGADYLLDMQYKQFVPEEERSEQPDYLAIQYTSKQSLIDGLTSHGIPERAHDNWLDEIFPKPVSYSSLRTQPSGMGAWQR
jgi:hypothetical protein